VSNVTERRTGQTGQRSRSKRQTVLVTVAENAWSLYVRAPYIDKSNGDGVEIENSFTFGVIGVAVSGLEEATSGLAKLLPVEQRPPPVSRKPLIVLSELTGQQSETESFWAAEKYSR